MIRCVVITVEVLTIIKNRVTYSFLYGAKLDIFIDILKELVIMLLLRETKIEGMSKEIKEGFKYLMQLANR